MEKYIYELKSTKPAPGGGSVAAVLIELSSALLHMACSISSHASNASEEKRSKLNVLCERIDACIDRSEALALRDEEAYREVARAIKIKAHACDDIAQKQDDIQKACLDASSIPCEVIDLALEIFTITKDVAPYINNSLMSDVAIVLQILQAAAKSALYLVHANLSYLSEDNAQRVYKRAHESFDTLSSQVATYQEKLDASLLVEPTH